MLALLLLALPQERLDLDKRWVYCSFNLWVDKNVDTLEGVMRRSAKAGYTGILLADSKFGKLGDMDARYFRNIGKVKGLAAELKLEIVPALFPVGYSGALLWHDPNLAEALPVRDAPFVVKDGVARLEPDRRVLAKPEWKDEIMAESEGGWTVTDPRGSNARVVFRQKVTPFRQYHVSVKVKSESFKGEPRIQALVGNKALIYSGLGVKATQDWSEHHAVFNSLENDDVRLYLGCWDGGTGTLSWKDAVLEEVGLLNVVRRDGAPLVVSMDGKKLAEGADFDAVADPRMGTVPWKGGYDVWHEPPSIRTKLRDGTRLAVSYFHVVTIHDGQVGICPSEPKTLELLRDQAKRMHDAWGAKGYFMSHDEIRAWNWCKACQDRKLDAGAMLADNAKACVKILREINPKGDIYVWSDMFDPHHNARKDYYLARGDFAGAWDGLDKDVIIAAWHIGARDKTLPFFADRGHRILIAGYYDHDPGDVTKWLDASRKVKGVCGVMYTTWQNRYDDLENFARIVDEKR